MPTFILELNDRMITPIYFTQPDPCISGEIVEKTIQNLLLYILSKYQPGKWKLFLKAHEAICGIIEGYSTSEISARFTKIVTLVLNFTDSPRIE